MDNLKYANGNVSYKFWKIEANKQWPTDRMSFFKERAPLWVETSKFTSRKNMRFP